MRSRIWWIECNGKLAIVPRPSGGSEVVDEMRSLAAAGVGMVVSLLTKAEEIELQLADERQACEGTKMLFLSLPIEDRGVPHDEQATQAVVKEVSQQIRSGTAVAVHCRAGIGRSGMFAARILAELGHTASSAFRLVSAARGVAVPDTVEQQRWVEQATRSRKPDK